MNRPVRGVCWNEIFIMIMEFYIDNVGAQYTIDKKKLIKLPSNIEEYEVVEGCKSFDNKAFEGCINLKTIILPYTFNILYDGCFDDCIYNHRTTKTNQKYPSVNL